MSRPRMWMEVGVWPPRAEKHRPQRTLVQRRPWIAVGVVAATILGAAIGSSATLVLVGQLGRVCA